jgi:Protein of unknown function (DUF3185)
VLNRTKQTKYELACVAGAYQYGVAQKLAHQMENHMNKLIGVICIVGGIALLVWGYNISQGVNSQVKNIFTGSPTDAAMYRYIAGGILLAAGIMLTVLKRK